MAELFRSFARSVVERIWGDLPSAAERGDVATVKRLLSLGANPNQLDSFKIFTVLFRAVQKEHKEVVEALLHAGADPNMPNANFKRDTPLHMAADKGNHKIIRLLLGHGADPEARMRGDRRRPLEVCKDPRSRKAILNAMRPGRGVPEAFSEVQQEIAVSQIHAEVAATRRRLTKHMQPAPRL